MHVRPDGGRAASEAEAMPHDPVGSEPDGDVTEGATEEEVVADEPPLLGDADMAPIETLDADSDLSPFFNRGVTAALRRAALRHVFSLPRYNVRDGLNDYDGDYTVFEPLGDTVTSDMRFHAARRAREAAEREMAEREMAEREMAGGEPVGSAPEAEPADTAQADAAGTGAESDGAGPETSEHERGDGGPEREPGEREVGERDLAATVDRAGPEGAGAADAERTGSVREAGPPTGAEPAYGEASEATAARASAGHRPERDDEGAAHD